MTSFLMRKFSLILAARTGCTGRVGVLLNVFLGALCCLGFALATPSAFAQDKAASAPPATQGTQQKGGAAGGGSKRTSIDFEDQLVEGQTQKPELFHLLQQKNNNFKRLIRLRENFLPEMRKTSEEVTRGGQRNGN